jgi:hypothetical protein
LRPSARIAIRRLIHMPIAFSILDSHHRPRDE